MKYLKRMAVIVIVAAMMASVIIPSIHVTTCLADNNYYFDDVVNTGWDNGYSKTNPIKSGDPHYGWKLGKFCVSGFTRYVNDGDDLVFLKNVGDTVTLSFILEQNINKLNDDKSLTISEDTNGYDQYFGTKKKNVGQGMLIIKKIDYEHSSSDPVVYRDYLDGVKKNAETEIQLCEEGDYEVALDYEIAETWINGGAFGYEVNTLPTYNNYRIFFKFSVRNGNCMVYPFDTTTGSELKNGALSTDGFYLDLANSRYLNIDIEKQVFTDDSGITTDTRFNRPATDGESYTDEGIYNITVSNQYTGETTKKTIYVGTNPVLMAYVVNDYSLDEIQDMISNGATVNEMGEIIMPVIEETTQKTEDVVVENNGQTSETAKNTPSEDNAAINKETTVSNSTSNKTWITVISIVSVIAVGAIASCMYLLTKNKKGSDASDSPEQTEPISNHNLTDTEEINVVSDNSNEESPVKMETSSNDRTDEDSIEQD